MEVGVSVLGHVIIEHNVDALYVHATAEQVGGDQNSLKIEEIVIWMEHYLNYEQNTYSKLLK